MLQETKDEQWRKATDFLSTTAELNYMTQINIMMFEDPSKVTSGLQIRVRIGNLFSLFLSQNICCGYLKEPSQ